MLIGDGMGIELVNGGGIGNMSGEYASQESSSLSFRRSNSPIVCVRPMTLQPTEAGHNRALLESGHHEDTEAESTLTLVLTR